MRDIKTLAFVCSMLIAACATTGGGGDDGTDPPPPSGPTCGDAVCAASEIGVCQADCGSGPPNNEVCGNGKCEGNEPTTCASDCSTASCGNNVCDMPNETNATCPGDCPTQGGGVDCNDQNTQFACFACLFGAGCTGVTEQDCIQCFGGGGGGGTMCSGGQPDGMCNNGETNQTCPFDCP